MEKFQKRQMDRESFIADTVSQPKNLYEDRGMKLKINAFRITLKTLLSNSLDIDIYTVDYNSDRANKRNLLQPFVRPKYSGVSAYFPLLAL